MGPMKFKAIPLFVCFSRGELILTVAVTFAVGAFVGASFAG